MKREDNKSHDRCPPFLSRVHSFPPVFPPVFQSAYSSRQSSSEARRPLDLGSIDQVSNIFLLLYFISLTLKTRPEKLPASRYWTSTSPLAWILTWRLPVMESVVKLAELDMYYRVLKFEPFVQMPKRRTDAGKFLQFPAYYNSV